MDRHFLLISTSFLQYTFAKYILYAIELGEIKDNGSLDGIRNYLHQFVDLEFGGEWSLNSLTKIDKLNSDFNLSHGQARMSMQLGMSEAEHIKLDFEAMLYEGEYRNNNIKIEGELKIDSKNVKIDSKNVKNYNISVAKAEIEFENGHLFSANRGRRVKCDVQINSNKIDNNLKIVNLIIKSVDNGNISLDIQLEHPYSKMVSGWDVSKYSILLFLISICFVNQLIVQTKSADESPLVAKRLSLFTLSWNTMWNMWLFNIHSTYALEASNYYMLSLPSIMYFIICIVFEITLLHICWRARNSNLALEDREEVRRQIIMFYLKFYVTYIIAVSMSDIIFSNNILLIMSNGFIWFPQIYENVINRARNSPKLNFAIMLSLSQGFMPVYYLFWDSNIFEIESSPRWGFILLMLHLCSIMILFGQK